LSTGSIWQLGSLKNPGWLQITSVHGLLMMGLGALALGLLYSSSLNRRLIIGVFVAGWIGLIPYSYEPFASSTNPPMNWGFASERSGFYYAVSREQYPKSLPNLIKTTIGKAIGVVPKDAQHDSTRRRSTGSSSLGWLSSSSASCSSSSHRRRPSIFSIT